LSGWLSVFSKARSVKKLRRGSARRKPRDDDARVHRKLPFPP
jgi:hypothetical protein